ncbi:MAG: NAD(P)-dependent oxidoreductase [Thermoplasmata archaeon]|nr:NAD(P)-dependent oxidoreductase [Thermoplasmata archaeon]
MKKSVLITGSTGFVGRRIARDLLNDGYKVYSLVFEGEPAEGTIPVEGDITRPATLDIPNIDSLVHCAGILESSHAPDDLMNRVNMEGTKNITNECFKAGIKNMVFMSTISAVGPQGTDRAPINENFQLRPSDGYGRSKMKAENFLKAFQIDNDIDISVIRPPVLFGEGMNPDSSAMKTFLNVKSGDFPLIDRGIHTFNFLYVGNLSHSIRLLLKRNRGFEIYNVNEGPYNAKDIISAISNEIGTKKGYRAYPNSLFFIYHKLSILSSSISRKPPRLSFTKYQALTTDVWKMDHTKIAEKIGYKPVYSLSEGVKRTIAFYEWSNS